jgi:hypothetical protein
MLVNHGAHQAGQDKADNEYFTSADIACYEGHIECLSLFIILSLSADCSKTKDDGRGPIHIACQDGYFES